MVNVSTTISAVSMFNPFSVQQVRSDQMARCSALFQRAAGVVGGAGFCEAGRTASQHLLEAPRPHCCCMLLLTLPSSLLRVEIRRGQSACPCSCVEFWGQMRGGRSEKHLGPPGPCRHSPGAFPTLPGPCSRLTRCVSFLFSDPPGRGLRFHLGQAGGACSRSGSRVLELEQAQP